MILYITTCGPPGFSQVFLCLITVELVEFLGRRFMLIASAVGMGTCLALLMLYQTFFPITDIHASPIESNEWHKYLPVILVCLYLWSYSIGWGPVVALVYAEVVYFDVSVTIEQYHFLLL